MTCAGMCAASHAVFAERPWEGTPAATSKIKIYSANLIISGILSRNIIYQITCCTCLLPFTSATTEFHFTVFLFRLLGLFSAV